nr:MAG TPA: hypothetical protein [Caudoviricetes sp.]
MYNTNYLNKHSMKKTNSKMSMTAQPSRIESKTSTIGTLETFATFMAYRRNKSEQLLVSLIKKTLLSLNVECI